MRRGHQAVISAGEDLAEFVRKAGIEAVPYAGLSMRELFDSPLGTQFLAKGQFVKFLRWAGAEQAEALGMRGLVVAGWTNLQAFSGDERLFIAPALNHDEVLPRCQAAVHHGGLGTTTATLAAGLPTLVCSVFLDQPFWGARVEELGAGARLPFQRFTAARLREALERLLSGPAKARAVELGAWMREEHGLQDTASFLEQHA